MKLRTIAFGFYEFESILFTTLVRCLFVFIVKYDNWTVKTKIRTKNKRKRKRTKYLFHSTQLHIDRSNKYIQRFRTKSFEIKIDHPKKRSGIVIESEAKQRTSGTDLFTEWILFPAYFVQTKPFSAHATNAYEWIFVLRTIIMQISKCMCFIFPYLYLYFSYFFPLSSFLPMSKANRVLKTDTLLHREFAADTHIHNRNYGLDCIDTKL